jgi:hypothetical protein
LNICQWIEPCSILARLWYQICWACEQNKNSSKDIGHFILLNRRTCRTVLLGSLQGPKTCARRQEKHVPHRARLGGGFRVKGLFSVWHETRECTKIGLSVLSHVHFSRLVNFFFSPFLSQFRPQSWRLSRHLGTKDKNKV